MPPEARVGSYFRRMGPRAHLLNTRGGGPFDLRLEVEATQQRAGYRTHRNLCDVPERRARELLGTQGRRSRVAL